MYISICRKYKPVLIVTFSLRVPCESDCGSETFSEFVLKTKSIAKIYKSHLIYSYLIKV